MVTVPFKSNFNDSPLWHKLNTQHLALTSEVRARNGGGTRFWNTASQSTVLKKWCLRMERVSPHAPGRRLRSVFRNCDDKRGL